MFCHLSGIPIREERCTSVSEPMMLPRAPYWHANRWFNGDNKSGGLTTKIFLRFWLPIRVCIFEDNGRLGAEEQMQINNGEVVKAVLTVIT